ncbi:MAG: hypothetical protein IKZ28_05470, partial [Clostridia bacterium]|nr:hypothetical protein [Clostridia bacterium]
MRTVAVFFGGRSCESEVSILTGVFVLNILDREKYNPIPVYVHTDGGMYTSEKMKDVAVFREKRYSSFERIFLDGGSMYALNGAKRKIKRMAKIDVALNCCHGGLGEGGGVSAVAEWNDIPLASPDIPSSAVFMDKCMTKVVARGLGIPTLDYIRVNESDYEKRGAFLLKSIEGRLKYPVVIKPAHLGSSIGIAVAKNEGEAKTALQTAFTIDYRAIIEPYLEEKVDVNCAVYSLNGEIFVSEAEPAFGEGLYSFEEKYIKRKSDGVIRKGETPSTPKDGGRYSLDGDTEKKIKEYTRTHYKRMNMKGVVRLDFLVSEKNVYLCEVNTVPGSLAYYLFCERLTDARTFFGDLLEEAIREFATKQKKILTT